MTVADMTGDAMTGADIIAVTTTAGNGRINLIHVIMVAGPTTMEGASPISATTSPWMPVLYSGV